MNRAINDLMASRHIDTVQRSSTRQRGGRKNRGTSYEMVKSGTVTFDPNGGTTTGDGVTGLFFYFVGND